MNRFTAHLLHGHGANAPARSLARQDSSVPKAGHWWWILFTAFILAGIISKRVYHHPEYLPVLHFIGTTFLVVPLVRKIKLRKKMNVSGQKNPLRSSASPENFRVEEKLETENGES